MDILKEIEEQVNYIKRIDNSAYLDAILTHIARAEIYYKGGVADSGYFNDVIYRSNQAYEGALKESYKVLAGKTSDEVLKKTPNDIEKYFETQNVFKDRVLQLFRNYRQEWRNKSTHDYQLFFDESEAFIALTSVSSFVHLLLKQIQEKVSYNAEQKKLESSKPAQEQLDSIADNFEALLFTVEKFANVSALDSEAPIMVNFSRIMGLLHAHLDFAANSFKVSREPDVRVGNRYLSPDFIVESGNEKFVIEVKIYERSKIYLNSAIDKVMSLMEMLGAVKSILYYARLESKENVKVTKIRRTLNGVEYEIAVIGN